MQQLSCRKHSYCFFLSTFAQANNKIKKDQNHGAEKYVQLKNQKKAKQVF